MKEYKLIKLNTETGKIEDTKDVLIDLESLEDYSKIINNKIQ